MPIVNCMRQNSRNLCLHYLQRNLQINLIKDQNYKTLIIEIKEDTKMDTGSEKQYC